MNPKAGGALLVLIAVAAAFGRAPQALFGIATIVWLLCLRRPAAAPWLILLVAAAVRLPFAFSDYSSDDLYRYVWEGRIQLEGYSPYEYAPAAEELEHLRGPRHDRINHPELTAIYPPLSQMLFAASAAAGLTETGLRNLILGIDVAVVAVLLGWLRTTGRPVGWAILYAWSPVVAASAGVGHIDPWMLLFLAGYGWAWEKGRFKTAALLLGGAILAKTVAVLLVPWLLLRRPKAALLTLPAVLLLGYLPYASPALFDTLYAFGTDFAFNGSLFRLFAWLAPGAAHAIVATLLAAWVGIVALTQPRIAHAVVLLFAGLLLLSPTVHFWYLSWFVVALPAIGPRRWTLPLIAWTVSSIFSSETYRAHYLDGEPFAERFPLTAIEYALPFALGAWLLWRHWPRPAALASPAASPAPPPVVSPAAPPATPPVVSPAAPPATSPVVSPAPSAALPEAVVPGRYAVVIPCRGEAENLRALLPRWLEAGAARVVVADTPTGDGTRDLTSADPRTLYVPVERRGYGAAVRAGLAAAGDVEFAVVCDADHARGPEQVGALLAPFADREVGLVTAARTGARLSPPQRFGNALSTFLIALGWGRRFHDLGPFRALRLSRWPAGALSDAGYGWNVEMNVRALEQGMGVVEVPLPASDREHGENRISGTLSGVVRAGYGILSQLYRLREQSCRQPSSS